MFNRYSDVNTARQATEYQRANQVKTKHISWKESKLNIQFFLVTKTAFGKYVLDFFSEFSFVRQSCLVTISLHISMFYLDVRSSSDAAQKRKDGQQQLHSGISHLYIIPKAKQKNSAEYNARNDFFFVPKTKNIKLPIIMSCNCLAKHLKLESMARNCASRVWPSNMKYGSQVLVHKNLIID